MRGVCIYTYIHTHIYIYIYNTTTETLVRLHRSASPSLCKKCYHNIFKTCLYTVFYRSRSVLKTAKDVLQSHQGRPTISALGPGLNYIFIFAGSRITEVAKCPY